ncbi:MAG: hypothetical protein ACTHLW_21805 [Verrucomicrobiota bacterium]
MLDLISLNPALRLSKHNLNVLCDSPKIVVRPECTPYVIVGVSKPRETVSTKDPLTVL